MKICKHLGAATIAALLCVVPAMASAHGTVDRLRLDPHGRVAGVYLRDGTEITAAPERAAALALAIQPGDAVHVVYNPQQQALLFDARTSRFVELTSATPAFAARGGGPGAPAVAIPYARVDDATQLAPVRVEGRVAQITHTAGGVPTGLLLDNGAQVDVVPDVAGILDTLSVGDALRIDGRGTQTSAGTSLWALTITSARRGVVLDMTRGVGAPQLGLGH
jgi:hypothetical protein